MGEWREGPGKRLTDAIDQAAGDARILAEDLGVLHESVRRLLQATGYPGMKVLLFAFDSGAGNTHLPHWFDRNSAVYGGTHDNETIAGYCAGKNRRGAAVSDGLSAGGAAGGHSARPAARRLPKRGGRGDFSNAGHFGAGRHGPDEHAFHHRGQLAVAAVSRAVHRRAGAELRRLAELYGRA